MTNKSITGEEITEYYYRIHPNTNTNVSETHHRTLEDAFLCLAAMHGRVDIFACNHPLFTDTFFNPLTVAVYHKDIELIQILVEAGYQSDQDAYAFRGIFSKDIDTALNFVLQEDDVEVMMLILPALKCTSQCQLLQMVSFNQAEKCFLAILQKYKQTPEELHMDSVYETALTFSVKVLKEMKRRGHEDFTRHFQHAWKSGTVLHGAPYLFTNTDPCSLGSILKYLISQGVRAYKMDRVAQFPIDVLVGHLDLNPEEVSDVDEFKLEYHYLLDGAKILLEAMRKERPGLELPIPRISVALLQFYFYKILKRLISTNAQSDQEMANLHLDICVKMLEMILATGVNLGEDAMEIYKSPSNYTIPPDESFLEKNWNCANKRSILSLPFAVDFTKYQTKIQVYEKQIMKMRTLLLVFGAKPDQSCFHMLYCLLEYNRPSTTAELVLPILSLMSAEDIHQFRKHVADTNAQQNKNVDISLVSEHFCKSLSDSCRYVLYNHIKHRRMAAHVNSLPLPTTVKEYLCLGYNINEKYFKRFGVKSDKNLSEKMQ